MDTYNKSTFPAFLAAKSGQQDVSRSGFCSLQVVALRGNNMSFFLHFPMWNKCGSRAVMRKGIPGDESRITWKTTLWSRAALIALLHVEKVNFDTIEITVIWVVSVIEVELIAPDRTTLKLISLPLLKHYEKKRERFMFFASEKLGRLRLTFSILRPQIQKWHLLYPASKFKLMETHMHITLQFSGWGSWTQLYLGQCVWSQTLVLKQLTR